MTLVARSGLSFHCHPFEPLMLMWSEKLLLSTWVYLSFQMGKFVRLKASIETVSYVDTRLYRVYLCYGQPAINSASRFYRNPDLEY